MADCAGNPPFLEEKMAWDADVQASVGTEVGASVLQDGESADTLSGLEETYGRALTLNAPTRNCSSTIWST